MGATKEEKGPAVFSTAVEDSSSPLNSPANLPARSPPKHGYFDHFPALGFGALFAVLLCTAASVLVLVLSDGKSQKVWGALVAPNVLINIFNNVANLCFAVAIANGIAVSWWRMAIKGADIQELHRSLSFNTFLKQIFQDYRTLKHFNVIALAALTAKLAIVDSTLLQKATYTYQAMEDPRYVTVSGSMLQEFPDTGRVASHGDTFTGVMSPDFSYALKLWAVEPKSLYNPFSGCDGWCFPTIEAIGFEIACSAENTTTIDYATQLRKYTQDNNSDSDIDQLSPPLFELFFNTTSDEQGNAYMNMTIRYADSNDTTSNGTSSCPGTLKEQTCALYPALVTYPVMVTDFSLDKNSHFSSDPSLQVGPWWDDPSDDGYVPEYDPQLKQLKGYKIGSHLNYRDDASNSNSTGNTHLAGIQEAFSTYLAGSTYLYYDEGYGLERDGNAPYYLLNEPEIDKCGYQFDSPISPTGKTGVETVIQKINEIMFTFAMGRGPNATTPPSAPYDNVPELRVSLHYGSNYYFMAGAIISTVVCVILILPSYWGYWQLGRKVSLNPFEIAHAFRAPMTANVPEHTEEGLIKHIGSTRVRYGALPDGRNVFGLEGQREVQSLRPAGRSGSHQV